MISILLWMALAAAAEAGEVAPEVREALRSGGSVRVIVAFDVPEGRVAPERHRFDTPAARGALRAAGDRLLSSVGPLDFVVRHRYRAVNALAGEVTPAGLARLLADPAVLRVDLEQGGHGGLAQSVPLAGLDDARNLGFGGQGVQVAVLDSGVDSDHPNLAGDVIAQECFCTSCCPNGSSHQSGPGSAEDDHGHGTHVTGIITSDGIQGSVGGAPDAEIVAVKVLDSNNSFCCVSDIIAALDWIITDRPDVDVVNLSLGTSALYPGNCDTADASTIALAGAINTLRADGVLSVVSSMNNGSGTHMTAPACVSNAISVGAVWDANVGSQTIHGCTDSTTVADKVTCFSNSNSTTDLFAPGGIITSSRIGGGTSSGVGTSQAAPHVAACAAALRQKEPKASSGLLELALQSSPVSVTDTTNGLSFPRLDCGQALQTIDPTPAIPVPALSAPGHLLLGALLAAVAALAARRRLGDPRRPV